MCWRSTSENVVEQRSVQLGQPFGDMRLVESGLSPDQRIVVAGILDAVPGQKVDPQLQAPAPPRLSSQARNTPPKAT